MAAVISQAERARRIAIIQCFQCQEGWTWRQIGIALGIAPETAAAWWRTQIDDGGKLKTPRPVVHWQPDTDVQLKPGQTRRLCMTCGKPFASDGPHNRLCATHRLAGTESPYAIDYVTTGRQVGARRS